jgi:pilus assembly protein Flp/PilA
MSKLSMLTGRFLREENGAAMVEYSILIGLISAAVITIIAAVGVWIVAKWTALQTALGA